MLREFAAGAFVEHAGTLIPLAPYCGRVEIVIDPSWPTRGTRVVLALLTDAPYWPELDDILHLGPDFHGVIVATETDTDARPWWVITAEDGRGLDELPTPYPADEIAAWRGRCGGALESPAPEQPIRLPLLPDWPDEEEADTPPDRWQSAAQMVQTRSWTG